MFDDAKVEEVLAHVRTIAARPDVTEVRDHFAGYFNELGLWVTFRDGTPDRDVIELGNKLAAYLNAVLPKGNKWFSWALSLERGGDTLDVVAPGDPARDISSKLAPLA